MKRITRSVMICAAALLVLPIQFMAAEAPKMPTPKADIYIVPTAQILPIDLKYPAQIKSFQNISVVSRVSGVLQKKYFQEGSTVKEGALLYSIEDTIYQAKVNAAEASVHISQAALDNTAKAWDRAEKLYQSKSISDETRDNALFSYAQAKASLALAKAQLAQAQVDLDYTKVKAPISGIIGLRNIDVGDYVTQEQKLVTITQNDKVFIEFSMPLSDYKNIQSGMWNMPTDKKIGVNISIDGQTVAQKGVVDFIDANINQNTSTVKMRAVVDNTQHTLMPGNFIKVVLDGIVQNNVITIPQKAVLQNPMGTIVFTDNNGIVGIKPVVIGNETDDKYIVAGGPIQSGDRIIINNFFRLKPGNPVAVDKIINK